MFPKLSAIEIQPDISFELQDELESESFVQAPVNLRQSQWDKLVVGAMSIAESVNPYEPDIPIGTVIPSIHAVKWTKGSGNCDIRPRLRDSSTGELRLLDSGSMITAAKRLPGDKVDNSVRLVAVNGSRIDIWKTKTVNKNKSQDLLDRCCHM